MTTRTSMNRMILIAFLSIGIGYAAGHGLAVMYVHRLHQHLCIIGTDTVVVRNTYPECGR
jgi:hypothetical protein